MRLKLSTYLLLLLSLQICNGQSSKDSVNNLKLVSLSVISAGIFTYAYGIQNDMWWKGTKTGFHTNWKEDWQASLGADKIGHFYFGNVVSTIYGHAFNWVGYSESKSYLYSGILSFSYQTFLEIRDGFSKNYGFSWGDFGANLFGSFYPYLQYRYPSLKNYNLKVSYHASDRFKNNSHNYIIDDYESTFHWLSIDINQFLPEDVDKVFPDIINFAIGHSVTQLDGFGGGQHELYLSLDWDINSLPGESGLLKFLKNLFNLYHFPAPAVKIYPNVVWYGLKF